MDRKEFLKISGLFMTGTVLGGKLLACPARTQAISPSSKRAFRGTDEGQILQSDDGGRSWRLHADFGGKYRVRQIIEERRETLAELDFQGQRFQLRLSPDGKSWLV